MPELPVTLDSSAVACAQRICADAFGSPIEVDSIEDVRVDPGYRHNIVRLHLRSTDSKVPDSVIVKQSNRGGGHILNEWAALAFFNELDQIQPIAPRLIGGDIDRELLVLEDVGRVKDRRLRDVLNADDPAAARWTLLEMASAFGRFQSAACGDEDRWREAKAELPAAASIDFHQVGQLDRALGDLASNMSVVGVTLDAATERELKEVRRSLTDPGPFATLVHGDICPSNVVLTGESIRVMDFEVAGWRHALLDGAYARLRHLNCLDAQVIPDEIQAEMEQLYREALSERCHAARDDCLFAQGLTHACAGWMIVTLSNLPRVVDNDKPRGPASYRQRIIASLDAFIGTTQEFQLLPALGATSQRLRARLADLWSRSLAPVEEFPVFRNRA